MAACYIFVQYRLDTLGLDACVPRLDAVPRGPGVCINYQGLRKVLRWRRYID